MTAERERSGREMKKRVGAILRQPELEAALEQALHLPLRQVVNPLCGQLATGDGPIKWRAVSVLGAVVARLAEEELEAARNVMRRLVWTLSDESGGIGWGAPEAMGEATARSEALADGFAHVLVAFIRQDGNYLEFEPLHPGILWGIGRLARARREHALDAAPHLPPYLESPDPAIRGTAAWAALALPTGATAAHLERLRGDPSVFPLYEGGVLADVRIGDLVARGLARLPPA
ncbi:MAG: HEAT repeat domain-containing protein [Deltaproteobacteria bacterium]|nr:HEAT repeat domain-containing protein [Deltaproteobacteria bacterium]